VLCNAPLSLRCYYVRISFNDYYLALPQVLPEFLQVEAFSKLSSAVVKVSIRELDRTTLWLRRPCVLLFLRGLVAVELQGSLAYHLHAVPGSHKLNCLGTVCH
jgi:hypothetical protein